MTKDSGISSLIAGISAKVGADIGEYLDKVAPLFDDTGTEDYLRLVSAFLSFDLGFAKNLLLTGATLFPVIADRPERNEAVRILADTARLKWSVAAEALRKLPSLAGQPSAFLVQWLERGSRLAALDQDVAIQFFDSSVEVLERLGAEGLDHWAAFGQEIAKKSWKAGREYFKTSPEVVKKIDAADIERWARLGLYLVEKSPKVKSAYNAHSLLAVGARAGKDKTLDLALEYFKSAPQILGRLSIKDLEDWVEKGLEHTEEEKGKGLAFFSLQTGASRRSMESLVKGLELKNIQAVLTSYVTVLFELPIHLRSSAAFYHNLPGLGRFISVTDGARVFLPSRLTLFEDQDLNIKAYKWLLAHEVAHLTYGTFELTAAEAGTLPEMELPNLAFRIFELLEDERVDTCLEADYPGLAKDRRMLITEYLKLAASDSERQPSLFELYSFNSLGGFGSLIPSSFTALPALRQAVGLVRSGGMSVREVLELTRTVCASLDAATIRTTFSGQDDMHRFFHRGIIDFKLVEQVKAKTAAIVRDMLGRLEGDEELDMLKPQETSNAAEPSRPSQPSQKIETALLRLEDARGLDNEELIWQITDEERLEQLVEQVKTTLLEMEEEGRFRRAVPYDEWDYKMDDYKKDWCRVREMDMPESNPCVYDGTVKEYYGLVSILKRHFGMLRPDRIKRHFREERGDDLDFDALVETMTERHAGVAPSDKIYIRRDKKLRDVSVAFLADMSFSTSDVLSSGKRIIDVERDGLVLMAEALESIGDRWAVYGFSSEYREKVDFFVVKDFNEPFGLPVKMRFEGIRPIALTRLGAAIRHANSMLQKQDSLIRLLILLSDGRPYDVDYGDADYGVEDTRMALWEGRRKGINSFCITVDKKSREYLPHMYGDANYTVIDNIDALPMTLPLIYKKLTT